MRSTIIIAVVAALGGGGWLALNGPAGASPSEQVPDSLLYTVQRGTLTITVTEHGSLNAENSEKVTLEAERGGKITFLVEEGKTVEEGEVIGKLDTTELEDELQRVELDIVKTEADLDTARTELDIQKSDNEATIEKARIALTKAKNDLKRYEEGDAPKERRNLEVAIKEAQTKHSRAKKKYEDSVVLLEQNYINKSQCDEDQIDFERAVIQMESAERDLAIFKEYTFPMTLLDKQTAVSDAERDLKNAEKRAASTLRQREVAVESQESRLDQLKKQRDELKENIEKFTLKAPVPGIVIYGDPDRWWYSDEIKLGGQVWGGFTMFTIPDLRVMQVDISVHEADIDKVAEGQEVAVTMDTYPGLVLAGKVSKIASVAGSGGRRGQREEVKKFTVEITLASTEGKTLKPGISAKAEVFIDERPDVLYVPVQCVFFEEGKHYCYLQRGGPDPVRVEVTPGMANDAFVEIAEGLEAGDRVLLYNPVLHTALGDGDTEAGATGEADANGSWTAPEKGD